MGNKDYKITARLQKGWNWMVGLYLFLGGLGAGAYVVGAVAGFIGWAEIAKVGVILSLPAVAVGTIFLLAHLGQPMHAYLAPSKAGTSWISRGVIFIALFFVFSFIHIVGVFMGIAGGFMNIIAILGIIFATGVMVYTGALLSAAKGIPLWENGLMPVLFMFSALVTGLFTVMIISYLGFSSAITETTTVKLALSALGLLGGEIVILFFYLYSSYQEPDARDSVNLILGKNSFVFGDLVLGLIVPILLMAAVITQGGGGPSVSLILVGGILAVVGGLMLRLGILSSGMRASYNIGGWDFKLSFKLDPPTPKGSIPPGNI